MNSHSGATNKEGKAKRWAIASKKAARRDAFVIDNADGVRETSAWQCILCGSVYDNHGDAARCYRACKKYEDKAAGEDFLIHCSCGRGDCVYGAHHERGCYFYCEGE